ncbi:MAG: hypothetical protein ACSHXW_14535 [Yoonia sp.]
MSSEPSSDDSDEQKLLYAAILADLVDYDRVWRIGDPTQEELSNFFSKRIPTSKKTNFHIVAYSFLSARNGACHDIWSGVEQAKNLLSLKKKIAEISRLYSLLPDVLTTRLLTASIGTLEQGEAQNQSEADYIDDYLQIVLDRATPGLQGYTGLQLLAKHSESLLPAFDEAIEETNIGIPQGTKAIEAWRYVEACEHICRPSYVKVNVPKFLSESGDFYRLLSDVFHLFEIENDPVDMFKAWKKHVGRSESKIV